MERLDAQSIDDVFRACDLALYAANARGRDWVVVSDDDKVRLFGATVDFDEADWRDDAQAFVQSCRDLGVPAALEISRSGSGAHAWIFFEASVPAREARRLGTAIITHTCARTRQLELTSYDRLFPNQDTMPNGGFGNLIALPLQKAAREKGFSVFVDDG